MTLSKKGTLVFLGIIALFLLVRIPGVHIPYHQDEYKWPVYAAQEATNPGAVPHPPLSEFIYTRIGPMIGLDNFRFIPLVFSFLDLLLIFYLAYIIFGKRTALWTAFLFSISFFSVLASLMVDVDGAIMPFFLLLMFIGYYKWKEENFTFNISNIRLVWWIALIIIGAVGGFLVKIITALPILALAIDYFIEKNIFSDAKKTIKAIVYVCVGALALVLVLVLSKFVFPYFKLDYALGYWEHFINFGSRGWFQTFIQVAKSILFCSPLLLISLVFGNKGLFKKTRPFIVFIALELFTYIIAFDFSTGAIDRYFQFLVVPLCIIVGAIFAEYVVSSQKTFSRKNIGIALIISAIIFSLQYVHQFVPSLYPKSAWVGRIVSLKWNFLYVFSGGSGPFPFYISFAFIAFCWIVAIVCAALALSKKDFKPLAVCVVLVVGLMYNVVFVEEYVFGVINGSSVQLLQNAVAFIKNDPAISKVVVYNDNGGYEIQETGKYEKRLYTSPDFDINGKIEGLNAHKDFYLELNIPRIDPVSVYRKYLDSCKTVYSQTDKYISAIVYNCNNAPDVTQ